MKPTLYVETTIPSYLKASPSRDLIIAGHQQITREWWDRRRKDFDIYVSQFVIDEASGGDPEMARERLRCIEQFSLLEITEGVSRLAEAILAAGLIPRKAATDSAHIAVAAVHGVDYLMTWNCAHIANATITRSVRKVCDKQGYQCPVLYTRGTSLGARSMLEDPIVEEVRKIREALARKFDFDISAIVADARKRQDESGRKVVSLAGASRPDPTSTPKHDEGSPHT